MHTVIAHASRDSDHPARNGTHPAQDGAQPVYGLLLCGGRSSRMGQDKALLQHGGDRLLARGEHPRDHSERMLDRGLRLLHEAGCQQVWAAGDYTGVPCLPDAACWQGRGPLAGLASAVTYAPHAGWLVIPVDMPGLDSALLRRFLQLARQYPHGAAMQHSQFPLFLAHPAALDILQTLLATPDARAASIGALLKALALPSLPPALLLSGDQPSNALCNTNTPAEWQAFCQTGPDSAGAMTGTHHTFAV